ncbi:hypothetical protein GDO78_020498 [Eleutherodactylus coqui]|uniref:Uncharacterized protein n=1 Tax=Eleutherodactylus coqui TaxID=57060 RepID=A0A8J6BIF4_ELECQ|nr:hypothetical protein GDO78_020498 [Eleutherodactylus coqui]
MFKGRRVSGGTAPPRATLSHGLLSSCVVCLHWQNGTGRGKALTHKVCNLHTGPHGSWRCETGDLLFAKLLHFFIF